MDPSKSLEDSSSQTRANEDMSGFLESDERLAFPVSTAPELTVVIVSWGRLELLWACLRTLLENSDCEMETIIAFEETDHQVATLLSRVSGARVVTFEKGASFARRCNQGAKQARTANILFLKEDVRVAQDALRSTLERLLETDGIGAVGAMLLDADGATLEAGSLLFSGGHCRSFGRGWNPDDYRVQYRREVAFCSGAYLAFVKQAFDAVGGFDETYLDEYYEDVDICLKLEDRGYSIVYDPRSVAVRQSEHREPWECVSKWMQSNREILRIKWAERLESLPAVGEWTGEAVFEKAKGSRILWIEDAPPFAYMGAGFPRTREMLSVLIELGHSVTLLPTFITASDFDDVYRETPREVEVALGVGEGRFDSFWKSRRYVYDTVILSRPNNLKRFCKAIEDTKKVRPELRLIYDAEAIFANREISERRYTANPFTAKEERSLLEEELAPARSADVVFAISEMERTQFESLGFANIQMLRHYSKIVPTPKGFSERSDILFVGAIHSDEAPNALGLIWFIENALPLIRARLGFDIKLYFAGKNSSKALEAYETETEVFLGFVEDLDEWYDRCRVFIAPARYAAGIPLKVIEASSRGIPVVGAALARDQLGWSLDEMLSAETASDFAEACIRAYTDEFLWARLRTGALERVKRDYSRKSIVDALRASLG